MPDLLADQKPAFGRHPLALLCFPAIVRIVNRHAVVIQQRMTPALQRGDVNAIHWPGIADWNNVNAGIGFVKVCHPQTYHITQGTSAGTSMDGSPR